MAKWKLCRQTCKKEEYELSEGDEVTIGRGLNNKISFPSIVISRNHCLLNVKNDRVIITDLKSANGIYVGSERIPPNIPYSLEDDNIIGLGWTFGTQLIKVNKEEQFVFKLMKCATPIKNRIKFQADNEIETTDDLLCDTKEDIPKVEIKSPVFNKKLSLKRKSPSKSNFVASLKNSASVINLSEGEGEEDINDERVVKKIKLEPTEKDIIDFNTKSKNSAGIINLSDGEADINYERVVKKIKLEPTEKDIIDFNIKSENEDFQCEAYKIKQEYLGWDDEPIEILSDSDSESELFVRLSQSSPSKVYNHKISDSKVETHLENSSYSQLDDTVFDHHEQSSQEDFIDDIIYIPPEPQETVAPQNERDDISDIIYIPPEPQETVAAQNESNDISKKGKDTVDGVICEDDLNIQQSEKAIAVVTSVVQKPVETVKMALMIDPLIKPNSKSNAKKDKTKPSKKTKSSTHSSSSSKNSISNSQKEERKKKLKEIASKVKEDTEEPDKKLTLNPNKAVFNVKITTSNRGAFLIDDAKVTSKPAVKEKVTEKEKNKSECTSRTKTSKSKKSKDENDVPQKSDSQNKKVSKTSDDEQKKEKRRSRSRSHSSSCKSSKSKSASSPISLKNLKPLTDSKESMPGKPVSKVQPLTPKKLKKQVRFSDVAPKVIEYEIEPGNMLRSTKSVRTRLVDARKLPQLSLEKITLMKILRWNPQWLDEQIKFTEPPPILGHNNPPMALFHNFTDHQQYAGLVGDLLLMEIWECLTQAYMRTRPQFNVLQLRVESIPPVPPQERYFDLCNLSVNISLLTSENKKLPRVGEIMILEFGPENARICRFFFVHNVRALPSPPNNKNSFYSLSLYATFTEKIQFLKQGEVMFGRVLAYINNELTLFDAMEYLAGSPLSDAILSPKPHHFAAIELISSNNIVSSKILNPSQKLAVTNSVSAALGDRPCIQMVQGPPGTGKSSVICAIVTTYFYNTMNKRLQNRGKILICATSNAAVDELVIRLLDIRQRLPKEERFRMVRVGRLEAMASRARDVSSQQLAQRDAARAHDYVNPAVNDELAHLDAKMNMWKTNEREAKNPERVAYCRGRITQLLSRIALIRSHSSGGDALRPDLLAAAERRIVERADIIVTTLSSAHNNKMKGLKGRISLCIVDEAGQAIEPEALIPLTLDVTKLTLVGDPQQLPGFICSQRAKHHGLGESLFGRLSSCSETWPDAAVVLLDVQYRMHPAIAEYPSRAFYGGRVVSAPPVTLDLPIPPYSIIGISSGDKGQSAAYANETEAWGVARVAAALAAELRPRAFSLAVITPYSAQRDLLRNCLKQLHDPSGCAAGVEVNTVDSFQGQERDIVVVSLARTHGVGFLTDAGRMNVMLTRAKHALLVCLNPQALLKNNQWQTLIEDAQKRKLYTRLPNQICQPATRAIRNEEVLKYIKTHR